MITASHLPFNRNGFKFFTAEGGLEKGDIKEILTYAASDETTGLQAGTLVCGSFMDTYAKILADKIRTATGEDKPLDGFRIVVDAGNGAGGFYVDKVLKPLGAVTDGSLDDRTQAAVASGEDCLQSAQVRTVVVVLDGLGIEMGL